MAEALILDSEALNAIAHAKTRGAIALRARAIMTTALERRALVRVPAPVLAEVCRGRAEDAAVERVLNGRGIVVVSLTESIAREAGKILAKARVGSAHAVDAFVVATALAFESAVIATGDGKDIERLSAGLRSVRVFQI
jgi:predicted nucleic acid-binding protein